MHDKFNLKASIYVHVNWNVQQRGVLKLINIRLVLGETTNLAKIGFMSFALFDIHIQIYWLKALT